MTRPVAKIQTDVTDNLLTRVSEEAQHYMLFVKDIAEMGANHRSKLGWMK